MQTAFVMAARMAYYARSVFYPPGMQIHERATSKTHQSVGVEFSNALQRPELMVESTVDFALPPNAGRVGRETTSTKI